MCPVGVSNCEQFQLVTDLSGCSELESAWAKDRGRHDGAKAGGLPAEKKSHIISRVRHVSYSA